MDSIVVNGLHKSYGKIEALSGISFSVEQGEIFGIIGADGAGKTTLIRILTTLILPDSGIISVDGYDCVAQYKKIRNCVGYMPGHFSLYQDLTVEENLKFFASIFDVTVEENYYLIKDIYSQIEPFKKRLAGNLSGGMKQKLALCCALIHRPTVLFLDEPTTGVDAMSRREFWIMLHRLKQQNITVLVSTPYMDEALQCNRIALIHKGKFLTIDTPQNIINNFGEGLLAVSGAKTSDLLQALRSNKNVTSCYPFGDSIHITTQKDEDITNYLAKNNFGNAVVKQITPSIEDCFLKIVTHGQ